MQGGSALAGQEVRLRARQLCPARLLLPLVLAGAPRGASAAVARPGGFLSASAAAVAGGRRGLGDLGLLPAMPTDDVVDEISALAEPPTQSLLEMVSRISIEDGGDPVAKEGDAAADAASPPDLVESRAAQAQRDMKAAKQQIESLPSYCEPVSGVPYASALRARAIASLGRLHLPSGDLRTPSDPVEWACSHPWSAWFLYGLVFWVGMSMVAFIYASFWYRSKIPRFDQASALDPEATFLGSHFGCMSDWNSCVGAFIFPAVRWADTMHMAGILSFWVAFWLLTVCELPALLFGVFGFVLVAPLVFYRQRLREKLGVASGNETYVSDCFYAFFCSCCLISQEARVINEAYVMGHMMVPVSGGRPD